MRHDTYPLIVGPTISSKQCLTLGFFSSRSTANPRELMLAPDMIETAGRMVCVTNQHRPAGAPIVRIIMRVLEE
jgi:hypothetical protein